MNHKVIYTVADEVGYRTRMLTGRIELRDDYVSITGPKPLTLPYSQIEQIRPIRLRGVGDFIHFRCEETPVVFAVPRFALYFALSAVINSCKTWALYHVLVVRVTRTCRMQPEDKLLRETEWSITYGKKGGSVTCYESKFLHGTASITFTDLCLRWLGWSVAERLDFCQAYRCADKKHAADIIRFLARDETEPIRMTVALSLALVLPAEEAFPILADWAESAPVGRRANFFQALAHTRHPEARSLIDRHYQQLCEHPALLDNAQWYNEVALELLWCIQHLLELGVSVDSLRPAYVKLRDHPCKLIREQAERFLASLFPQSSDIG